MNDTATQAAEPLVSVIMNCYNGERFLREAIESVVSQTYQRWELIIWDNASTDSSAEIIGTFGDKRIKYFRSCTHSPLGFARNEALNKSTGEYVAFLDTDDYWYSTKLSAQIAYFNEHPETDFLYSNLLCFWEGSDQRLFRRHIAYVMPQPTGRVFRRFLRTCPVNLQTVMIRQSLLTRMDELFDPNLHVSEEFDLFMRMFHDCNVGYLHKVLAGYRLHAGQDSRRKIELYPVEHEYILQKLCRCFPTWVEQHREDFQYCEAKVAYYRCRVALRHGDRRGARELLFPHRWTDWRFGLLYLLLRLPGDAFTRLHSVTGRYQ